MCEKEIYKPCDAPEHARGNCDYKNKFDGMYSSRCKRRTLMLKHSKSLVKGYRKYSTIMSSTVVCQISFIIQILLWIVTFNGVVRVNASTEYNRLSISDTHSFGSNTGSFLDENAFNDFRHVSHEELVNIGEGFDNFTDPGVTHFSEILFDFDHYQVCKKDISSKFQTNVILTVTILKFVQLVLWFVECRLLLEPVIHYIVWTLKV